MFRRYLLYGGKPVGTGKVSPQQWLHCSAALTRSCPRPVSVDLSDAFWARGALGPIAGVLSKRLPVTPVCTSLGAAGQAVRVAPRAGAGAA